MKTSRRHFLTLAGATLATVLIAGTALAANSQPEAVSGYFSKDFSFGYPYRVSATRYGEDAGSELLLIEDDGIFKIATGSDEQVAIQLIPASTKEDPGRIRIRVYLYEGKSARVVSNTFASTLSEFGPPGSTLFRYPSLGFDLLIDQIRY